MTVQQAPFSFHCRICYERLNLTDRPPVVLPCGHTYICQVCSQKLTRCMECRTIIYPEVVQPKKKSHRSSQQNGYKHYRQRQQNQRQNYYLQKEQKALERQQALEREKQAQQFPVPTTVDELHSVCKAVADEEKPPLPKNVVLMSLMEAAEQKQASLNLQQIRNKDDEEGYESGDDDALVLDGLRTLSSSYGSYVVKAKDGIWVYDSKPPPLMPAAATTDPPLVKAPPPSRNNSFSSNDPPGKSPTKENEEPNPTSSVNTTGSGGSSNSRALKIRRRSHDPGSSSSRHYPLDPTSLSDTSCDRIHFSRPKSPTMFQKQPKAIEKLLHGQTVEVVCFAEGLAQLARAGGYIRVEHDDDLVKVGETTDEACRIEGMIYSIAEEKKQFKKRISDLHKLEKSLQANLRKFYIREAEEQEELRQRVKLEKQLEALEVGSDQNTASALGSSFTAKTTSVAEALLEEDLDVEMMQPLRNVTPPSTPPPHLLEMSPSSMTSGPETPASPRSSRRRGNRSANSSSQASHPHTTYHYEMQMHSAPPARRSSAPPATSTPAANQNGDNKNDSNGGAATSWEEDIFNQGCDLFFCATMPLCVGHNTTSSAVTGGPLETLPPLEPTSSILANGTAGGYVRLPAGSPYRSHHLYGHPELQSHLQHHHHHMQPHYIVPTLDRNESYGNGSTLSSNSTVNSGVVDFATGLSGHMGISRGKRRALPARRKQVRMMSQHDGIAHIRRQQKGNTDGSVISGFSVATL